jgi:CubicO group peptidase (beta-lactamase class C family)
MVLCHIAKTDDTGLDSIFQARIAKPMGVRTMTFIQTPYTRAHKAQPYTSKGTLIDWAHDYWVKKEDGKFYAPSSVHTTSRDFAQWMTALMRGAVLSPAMYQELWKPHSEVPYSGLTVNYTLGFSHLELPATNLLLHSGDNVGFTAWYVFDPDREWGFVITMNSNGGEQLGEELIFYFLLSPHIKVLAGGFVIILIAVFVGIGIGIRSLLRRRNQKKYSPMHS